MYAYRPNKSALSALDETERIVKEGHMQWSLKMDIAHFFDEISISKLKARLAAGIHEEDVILLIVKDCTAPRLADDGRLVERKRGIYQGSAIAPILSNIYLMDFDKEMEAVCPYYLRCSDDMLVLTQDREMAERVLQKVTLWLESLGLVLNEKKICIRKIAEGFEFLGYAYDCNGKSIPGKAQDNLVERLETMWYMNRKTAVKERLQKGTEILEGWAQYFRGEREISSIYEYAVVLHMTEKKDIDIPERFMEKRKELQNTDQQLCSC